MLVCGCANLVVQVQWPDVLSQLGALTKYFKHESLCPGQLEVILQAVHGSDVFVQMATGNGKTLCMFLSISDTLKVLSLAPMGEHVRFFDHHMTQRSDIDIKLYFRVLKLTSVGVRVTESSDCGQVSLW